jgi:hypothetical protein
MVVAFLTGHDPVKKHLNTLRVFDGDPNCRFCKLETETAYHIICCCEALVASIIISLGSSSVNPNI